MKAFKLTIFSLLAIINFGFAQQKPVQKSLIKTPTVLCEECKNRIENRLIHDHGMVSVKANYRNQTVSVAYITDRTNIENIKTSLANMGYDADDVIADADAYKRLPKSCQHHAGDKPLKLKSN